MFNKFTFLLSTLLILSFGWISFGQDKPENIHFKIIQTTDVHGAILPFDYIRNTAKDHSLASVSTYVNNERSNKDQEVILLDNGDILQGQPLVYYSNFENADTVHICSAAMNYMKYDAATIGNHDIEAGHGVYDKIAKEFLFPWMAANAVDTKTGSPYFKPYTIIEKQGVKIAILGLITPSIPKWLPENIWKGIVFEDMVESAKKWVDIIKNTEKPDILIGLFHAGIDYTYNNETDTTFKNENATKLVLQKVPGFDVVFGGHDHQQYNEKILNSAGSEVLLLDPSNGAQIIAVADIKLEWDEQTRKYTKSKKGQLIEAKKYAPDTLMLKHLKPYHDKVDSYINRVIGENKKTISARESLFGNSAFIDFIQQIQMEISGAEISFAAPLNFDFEIKEGPISVRDMFKLYRFENLLYSMVLSGQEIKNFLEYSHGLWFNQMKSENDALLKYEKNEKGKIVLENPFYNFSSAAGIIYTVDVSKPTGNRIQITSLSNGKKFKLNKKYKVAINSYTGNGGGDLLTTGAGINKKDLANRIVFSTEKDLRFYMMKYIEKKGTIQVEKTNNWKIIPEVWWEKGKERDYKLLFPVK